jgi:glucose-1-phosphate thymidylyltransferase
MKVLILAGGYGTRLYPVIKDIPKALLEVCGKTLIDHTLEKFKGIPGIDEIMVVTNAKFYDLLSAWAQGRSDKTIPLRVINDGTHTPEDRLGAIGDILFVLKQTGIVTDLVVAGSDNLFNYAIKDFFSFGAAKAPSVTIGCYDLQDLGNATKYGVIELDPTGKILSMEEKPKNPRSTLISMCLYYFPKESLPNLQAFVDETKNPDTTGGYLQWLYKKTPVYGFKFSGKWYDIGSLESYNDAQANFSK